jgi:hypothetical protein
MPDIVVALLLTCAAIGAVIVAVIIAWLVIWTAVR